MHKLNKGLQDLALLVAVQCVRNTVIEKYHARGSLSQADMKAFNRQVANNIYTFLIYAFDRPQADLGDWIKLARMWFPSDWDAPKFNQGTEKAITMMKEMGARVGSNP